MMTWAGSMTRGRLLHLHRLRDDILRGDLRALYLAWLASAARSAGMGDEADEWDDAEEDAAADGDELIEPPVPPGSGSSARRCGIRGVL